MALRCNVFEVPKEGFAQKYRNERVAFFIKNDTLRICSSHVMLKFIRKRSAEKRIKSIKAARLQFALADTCNEMYVGYYTQKMTPSKLYLYFYIIGMKHVKPAYLFTNDPNFVQ